MEKPQAEAGSEDFLPFADDRTVHAIGALSVENGRDRIAVHGNLDITRDVTGLNLARSLLTSIDAIVRALESGSLPHAVAEDRPATEWTRNPFA